VNLSFVVGNFKTCRKEKEVYLAVSVKFKIVIHTKSTVSTFRVWYYGLCRYPPATV